jgi:hypothetical protein
MVFDQLQAIDSVGAMVWPLHYSCQHQYYPYSAQQIKTTITCITPHIILEESTTWTETAKALLDQLIRRNPPPAHSAASGNAHNIWPLVV